jgi:hypothetical protein
MTMPIHTNDKNARRTASGADAGSVTWDEAVKKLRNCDCGAPIFEFTDDTGTDDWQRFAECSFCDFRTQSHWEPQVVLDEWNNRGGKCEECGTGICETEDDEICRKCWDKAKSPNNQHEARR